MQTTGIHIKLLAVSLVLSMKTIVTADEQEMPKDLFDSVHSQQLTRREFLESITDGQVHVVEFFSEDCRACQKFAREWKEIAEHFKDRAGLRMAQVNCSYEGRLCRQRGVNSYPTIKVFQNGEEFITYEGILFGELIQKFIASVANDLLEETTA